MELLVKNKFKLPVNRDEVCHDWSARGYSCAPFVDPPGRIWRDYVHDCNELVTVLNGSLQVWLQGHSFILHPGDELLIPASDIHTVKNIDTDTTSWLYGYD